MPNIDSLTSDSVPIYLMDALDECSNNFCMPAPREEVLDLVDTLVSLRIPKSAHLCHELNRDRHTSYSGTFGIIPRVLA
jgi:hypothetical protein